MSLNSVSSAPAISVESAFEPRVDRIAANARGLDCDPPQTIAAQRVHDEGDDCGHDRTERTVAGRIASILDAFNAGQQVLTLGELSQSTQLPKSTLHRLADQLCGAGWLERDRGGYRVGIRLFELGCLAVEGNRLQEAAFPHLQSLATKTGMSVQLGILDRAEVVYLERILVGPVQLPTRRGGRKPAYCTGLGKAMIAFDDEAVRSVLSSGISRKTPHTITEPLALRSELEHIREIGIAFDRGEAYEHLVCVAAPIRGSGRAIGAVSVTGLAGQMRWDMATQAVRSTAAAIWNANCSIGLRSTRTRM